MGDWDLDEWRAQEPKNCHSHLLSMLLGNTLMLPVSEGQLAIGACVDCVCAVASLGCVVAVAAGVGLLWLPDALPRRRDGGCPRSLTPSIACSLACTHPFTQGGGSR